MAPPPSSTQDPPGEPDRSAGDAAPDAHGPAERIIQAFGGIRPMAGKLGVPVTTVQGWKVRGHIPPGRLSDIRTAAGTYGVELDEATLAAATAQPEEPQAVPPAEAKPAETPEPARTSDIRPAEAGPAHAEPAAPAAARSGGARRSESADGPTPTEIAGAVTTGQISAGGGPFSRPRPRLLWTIAVSAVIAALVALTEPFWAGRPDMETVDRRLAALEAGLAEIDLAQLEAPPPTELDMRALDALGERIDGLGRRVDGVGQRVDGIEALAQRLRAVESSIDALGPPPPGGGLEALGRRLDEMAARLGGIEDRVQGALASRLAGLEQRADGLDGAIDRAAEQSERATAEAVAGLEAALGTRLGEAVGTLEARLAVLDRRLAAVEAADTRLQAAVVVLGQLRERLGAGADPREMLSALSVLTADRPELAAALDRVAAAAGEGLPSASELMTSFRAAAATARQAELAAADSWVGRLEAAAASLVTVRPAPGAVEGEGTSAILARAESRLGDGDLAGAIEAVEALTGPAARAMARWRDEAARRHEALASLDEAAAALIGRIAASVPAARPGPAEPVPPAPAPAE